MTDASSNRIPLPSALEPNASYPPSAMTLRVFDPPQCCSTAAELPLTSLRVVTDSVTDSCCGPDSGTSDSDCC
jgi:hypothetical protein